MLEAYVFEDRRRGHTFPDCTEGAALYADISGSMLFTEALVRELGARRGVEALTHYLNPVYPTQLSPLTLSTSSTLKRCTIPRRCCQR